MSIIKIERNAIQEYASAALSLVFESSFSQMHKFGNFDHFVLQHISNFHLYLHHMMTVNVKLNLNG